MANIPNFIVMLHHYKRQDDRQRIEIRIHFNRISKYYKTELLIHPEHFNPSGQIKTKKGKKDSYIEDSWILSSYHKFQEYNRVIASEIERLNAAWKELQKEKKTISASSILNKLNEVDSNASVLQFVNLEIRQKMQKSKLSAGPYKESFMKYFTFLKKQVKVDDKTYEFSGEDVYIDEFNHINLINFKLFLMSQQVKGGKIMAPSTIAKVISTLKSVLDRSPDFGDYIQRQFKNIPLERETEPKAKLSQKQVFDIYSLNTSEQKHLQKYIDIFAFCYYCHGPRIGEVLTLKVKDFESGRLLIQVEKSGSKKKLRDILLSEKALEILNKYIQNKNSEDYIFPFLKLKNRVGLEELKKEIRSCEAVINRNLKKIAELAGINKKLSTHVARASFITEAVKSKGDIYAVSKAVGHSKVETTEIYTEVSKITLDDLNDVYQK